MIRIAFIIIGVLLYCQLFGQVTINEEPQSFSQVQLKSSAKPNGRTIRRLNVQKELQNDIEQNIDNRYSVYKSLNINVKRKGSVFSTETGKVWRYQIKSRNSLSIALEFSEFNLPQGATLHIYNSDRSVVRGAFSSRNNKPNKTFSIADFPGDVVILEYYEPFDSDFSGKLVIGSIGRAYRIVEGVNSKSTMESNDININCEQGNEYQNEKHSVAKMTFRIDGGGYLCSGALLNNTRNDGALFFLTANHCISSEIVANTLITYFNYERVNCDGAIKPQQTLSGSVLKATNAYSDFTLLLLSEEPTPDYKVYFAGWDFSDNGYVDSGFGIHHPQGDVKKIAIDYDTIYSWPYTIGWQGDVVSEPNTHWFVEFNEGFTEGGSSGSPLFNNENRVVGQLHGGSEGFDFYGKLSSSWDEGGLDTEKLKPHLDPDNSGVTSIDAYYSSEIVPEAYLYTPFTTVCLDEPISFIDGSAFTVDSWDWQFNPSDVQYLNGTNSASQNPVVAFNSVGTYQVSLETSNSNGTNMQIRDNYIVSGNNLNPSIKALDGMSVCHSFANEIRFLANGAETYQWNVVSGNEYVIADSEVFADEFHIKVNHLVNIQKTQEIEIQLIGSQGECTDTVVEVFYLEVPDNDYIENSIELNYGVNGPFNNYCASVQENEPNPEAGSCNSQISWCECSTSEIILDNSVWFHFTAPSSGIVGFYAPGFDNQIAIYDAEIANDILSGDPSKYNIVAANDDYFPDEIENYAAVITGASVASGKNYWLQLDGSACGAFGEFIIEMYPYDITDSLLVDIKTVELKNEIEIFPNPVKDNLTIQFHNAINKGILQIVSVDGAIVIEKQIFNTNEVSIDVSNNIASGVYVVRFVNNEKVLTKQIVIQKE